MKKIIYLSLSIIMMFMTACSNTKPSSDSSVTSSVENSNNEALQKSKEAFEKAQTEEKSGNYALAIELYGQVISSDENYSTSTAKITKLQSLINSNNSYAEGIALFEAGDYNNSIDKFSLVISEDANYEDAQLKISESVNAIKPDLIANLEVCKSANDYSQALSLLSAYHTRVLDDEEIAAYKSHFEAAKSEHEAAIALEEKKNSYNLDFLGGIESYLREFYPTVETCIGTYTFRYDGYENDMNIFPHDFHIKVIPTNDYLFSDLMISNKYTSQQTTQAKKELKDFMYVMANDVMSRTSKKIKMNYDASYSDDYISGYGYISGDVDEYCSCKNFSGDEWGNYEDAVKTSFHWHTQFDDEQW